MPLRKRGASKLVHKPQFEAGDLLANPSSGLYVVVIAVLPDRYQVLVIQATHTLPGLRKGAWYEPTHEAAEREYQMWNPFARYPMVETMAPSTLHRYASADQQDLYTLYRVGSEAPGPEGGRVIFGGAPGL